MRIRGTHDPGGDTSPTTVIGRGGNRYSCPDLPSVDHHLQELRGRIVRARSFPGLVADLRAEIDLLLDRRLWLELTTTVERT